MYNPFQNQYQLICKSQSGYTNLLVQKSKPVELQLNKIITISDIFSVQITHLSPDMSTQKTVCEEKETTVNYCFEESSEEGDDQNRKMPQLEYYNSICAMAD